MYTGLRDMTTPPKWKAKPTKPSSETNRSIGAILESTAPPVLNAKRQHGTKCIKTFFRGKNITCDLAGMSDTLRPWLPRFVGPACCLQASAVELPLSTSCG
eukprot:3405284-Amphidinium_carterae.1